MTEGIDLEARIRRRTTYRPSICSACEWIDQQQDPALWDRLMALPTKEAGHFAIHDEMVALGFDKGRKAVEEHRNRGHRASD